MNEYWDKRFRAEGRIWSDEPSRTAVHALELFQNHSDIRKLLVPGSGYGRNTRLFAESGYDVTGIEISSEACAMARDFDPLTRLYNASVLDMSFITDSYNAVYCFNVLHLFREAERSLFLQQCRGKVRENGLLFFIVFSEQEPSFGKGQETEKNTFESKPGRPVHYFTEEDLQRHFSGMPVITMGLTEDPEDHGEGPHIHILRYICVRNHITDRPA
jgi:SAM-dependent methyltransferase